MTTTADRTDRTDRIISADSHVVLEHDTVKQHLASKHHVAYDDGVAAFQLATRGPATETVARFNMKGWDRPGHFDAAAHVADMDVDGVDVEVVYCEVSAFRYLYQLGDAMEPATRAFNDALSAYGSTAPDRLVVTYQIPVHDVPMAVREVERLAAAGAKSLQLPVYPAELGAPDYYDAVYDPLWAAIVDTGLPICCHTGLNTALDDVGRRDPTPQRGVIVPMMAMASAEAFGMWIMGGVFERHPGLKVVFVEPGLGWVAWWLQFADHMVTKQDYDFPAITELPSHYFHQSISLTFIEEPESVQLLRHTLGVENLLWSSDYPHPPSTWPNSRHSIEEQFAGIPTAERALMTCGNAARVWGL
jgi:predicted TIM-barrel fold metal-dependent hydrolase